MIKKNVLFITTNTPANNSFEGGRVINKYLLPKINETYNLKIIAIEKENDIINEIRNMNFTLYIPKTKSNISMILCKIFRGNKDFDFDIMRKIKLEVKDNKYSIIICDGLISASYVKRCKVSSKINIQNDSYSLLYKSYSKNTFEFASKVKNYIKSILLLFYERHLFSKFDKTIFVNKRDAEYLLLNRKKYTIIPIAIDFSESKKIDNNKYYLYDLIFTGNMDYPANYQSAIWLLDILMPRIWEKRQDTTIAIVGKNPGNMFQKYNSDKRVIITGRVDSVKEYIKKSRIYCAMVKSGAGMKIKVLEAMVIGTPVIGTTEAFSGYEEYKLIDNISNDIYVLASRILEILCDNNIGTEIATYNFKFASEMHSTEIVLEKYINTFNEVME